MRRRAFLKLVGLAGVASTVPLQVLARVVEAGGKSSSGAVTYGSLLYAPGVNGQILVSADRGRTWTVHANFGATYSVQALSVAAGRLVAATGFDGRGFPLYLSDDRLKWVTA